MIINIGIGINSTHEIFHEIKNIITTDKTSIMIDLNMLAKLVVSASRNKVQSLDILWFKSCVVWLLKNSSDLFSILAYNWSLMS